MNQTIISAWLGLSGWKIFLTLIVCYLATAAMIVWVCFRPKWHDRVLSFGGIVPPFFVAPAIVFSLMMAFLASDVWERDRLTSHVVLDERDAVKAVYEVSAMTGPTMPKLRTAARDYVASVLHDEWPNMRHQREAPETGAALDVLLRLAADPAIAQQTGQTVHGALLGAALRIVAARSSRLALSTDQADQYKWSVVLMLAVFAQIGVAMVHLDRARPQIMALLVFTASAVTALGLIAICEEPFHGAHQVSPAPLQALLTGEHRLS